MTRRQTGDIYRRLGEPVGVRDTKSKLYMALTRAKNDCADLLAEVGRLQHSLCGTTILLTKRIEELERQLSHGQPMNSSGEAVDDASAPYGLAQTTTGNGASPATGARKPDQQTAPPSQLPSSSR